MFMNEFIGGEKNSARVQLIPKNIQLGSARLSSLLKVCQLGSAQQNPARLSLAQLGLAQLADFQLDCITNT